MSKRTRILVVAAVFVVIVGLYGMYRAWKVQSYHFDDRQFDRAVWLRNRENHDNRNPRGQMAVDLRDKWLKKGMTKKEVKRLLGEPDWWAGPKPPENVLEYNLGNWSGCFLCSDVLDVQFDESGRLVDVEITEH